MASDEQTLNQLLLAAAVLPPLVVETVLWRRWPHVLAPWAYVPLGSHQLPLGPRLRAALTPLATYREAGRRHLSLGAWPGRTTFDVGATQVRLDAAHGRLTLRQPLAAGWFCMGGVVGARLQLQGDHLDVRLRGYPWWTAPALGFFAFVVVLAALDGEGLIALTLVTIYGLLQAVAAWRCHARWRHDADAVVATLRDELRRLEAP